MGKAKVIVSSKIVVEMVTKGWNIGKESIIECIEGVPDDAKLIEAKIYNNWNMYFHELELIFEHDTFENIDGASLPYLRVVHRTTRI